MTSINRLFCLVVLWTMAVDTQEETVYPLVMAVYDTKYWTQINYTDTKEANHNNFKRPLDNIEPKFIALLCGNTNEKDETGYFIVKQVIDKIDSIDKNLTCEHYLQATVREEFDFNYKLIHQIGFDFKVTEEILFKHLSDMREKEAATTESFKLLAKFTERFEIFSSTNSIQKTYFHIRYDFERNIPLSTTHIVKAHMHSNTYEEECKEIDVRKYLFEEKRSYEDLVAKFASKEAPSHHQWRQLVPMQDFNGIYTTQATCIYLNYLILHENTINTLKNIEFYIRMIADVINEVMVVTGTYTKEGNNADLNTVQNENTIPNIVWKKIMYVQNNKNYTILAVIHNKETERICSEKEVLGWPDDNKNEKQIGIGVMYYCSVNFNLSWMLDLNTHIRYSSFNLREVPYKDKKIDVLKAMLDNLSSTKTEKKPWEKGLIQWLSSMIKSS